MTGQEKPVLVPRKVEIQVVLLLRWCTLPRTNMEVENGPLEDLDHFTLQTGGCQLPC